MPFNLDTTDEASLQMLFLSTVNFRLLASDSEEDI